MRLIFFTFSSQSFTIYFFQILKRISEILRDFSKRTFSKSRKSETLSGLNRLFYPFKASHAKDLEKVPNDVASSKIFESKETKKDSMLTGVRLPFLHGFLPRGPGQTFHLTQLAHPPTLPQHLHVLPNHQSIADHHFQGFSAFRKLPSLSHCKFQFVTINAYTCLPLSWKNYNECT